MASYVNQVEVLWIEGFPNTPKIQAVVLDAYKMPATSNNVEKVIYREMDRVTVDAPSASRVTLPFTHDIDTWTQGRALSSPIPTDFGQFKWTPPSDRQQCVVVLDEHGGIIFRSPWFQKGLPIPSPPTGGLPPGAPANSNGFIDVFVPGVQITTAEQLNAELATRVSNGEFNNPPADPSTVVTSATVALGSGELTLTATGTRASGGFTYTLVLTISPPKIPFIWKDESGPMRAQKVTASISFVANPGHGLETFFLNMFSGWVEGMITPVILNQLNQGLVDNVRSQAARLAFGMPAQLPQEVILCVRRIVITDTGISGLGPGIYAWGTIGSFGRLLGGHLPKISTGSGRSCVVLAILTPLVLCTDVVDVLRHVRDAILLQTPAGERAVALYYEHSREMISLLATRPRLARKAAAIVNDLVDDIRAAGRVSLRTREGIMVFVHALLPLASPRLRRDIEETFRDDPWAPLQPCERPN